MARHSGSHLQSQLLGRQRLGGLRIKASWGQEVSETPISSNKPDMEVYVWSTNCGGGIGRRITPKANSRAKSKTLSEK
jgi:hypothetical protein